jgi:hypothetical protein
MVFLKTTYEKGEIKTPTNEVLTTWEVCVWNDSFPVIIENVLLLPKEHIIKLKKQESNAPMIRFFMDRWFYTHVYYMQEYIHWVKKLVLKFAPYQNYGNVVFKQIGSYYYIFRVKRFEPNNKQLAIKTKSWRMPE